MKFKDVRTIETILAEYGMKQGASTPTSQQQTGATAKATATAKSPTTQTKTPTKDLGSPTLGDKIPEPKEPQTPQPLAKKASELEVDAEYKDDKGEVAGKVVSKIGDNPQPDKVVIQDPKGEYQIVDPDQEVFIDGELEEGKIAKKVHKKALNKLKPHLKRGKSKVKKLARLNLHEAQQRLFEINFRKKEVINSSLDAQIRCGWEAESLWEDLEEQSDDVDNMSIQEVDDNFGGVDWDSISEHFTDWIYENKVEDHMDDAISEFVSEREDDEDFLNDFLEKIDTLDIAADTKSNLETRAGHALLTSVKPAYLSLISFMKAQKERANYDHGAWKFPDGEAFFNTALKRTTTTNLTANEIHEIGLNEVARIHGEMDVIRNTVGFEGTLQDFFQFMKTDKQFYYTADKQGKDAYLKEAIHLIDSMKTRLDELFITKPKADIKVKAVESFREKSAGKAFYNRPAADGSRPGIYYANLYDMESMPSYQMEALAYHEGIPGHHMQLAIQQELEDVPMFRKYGGYTAYTEGWGLYSEFIPKEMGFYADPYSDFGRLAMELWRACRLVVDTGIHSKKWTREEGIKYYTDNTPNAELDAIKMVERHIVMPGQATAYKIGMMKILELREKAKNALGDSFDLREFHEVVIAQGAIPLNVLEDFVDAYISSKN